MMKMPKIELNKLLGDYSVRKLAKDDIGMIYDLCRKNEIFYRFHPPFVTKESIGEDMGALPPGRSREDKFYIGFFDGDKLIAVMDFIFGYPQENVVYIGFFMVESAVSGRGIGTSIIQGVCRILQALDATQPGLPWMREIRRAVRSGGKTVLRKRGSGFRRASPCIL